MKNLIELHRVTAILTRLARICSLAKLAIDDANVGVVNVAVDVVISNVAVEALADLVGEPAQSDDVIRSVKFHPFFERKAFAAEYLVGNGLHGVENYT